MQFGEDFLYYIWKFRSFSTTELCTAQGETLEIISVGIHNKNSGPDFEHAKLKIGDTLWAGNVEIHIHSSDWQRHQHTHDLAYDNVILHVVYDYDKPVYRKDGTEIPVLVLKNRIPTQIALKYQNLMQNLNWIPCENLVGSVDEFHIKSWLSRVLIERLENKSVQVTQVAKQYKGSWDDAFYVMLAKNFGFKTNAVPFEMLARSLPQQILARHKHEPLKIEALILGQSGLLNKDLAEAYPIQLYNEYDYLRKKHGLTPMEPFVWKFMRLRPQNFPTLRIAQFAALVVKSSHLFSKIIEINDVKAIKSLLADLPVHPYWHTHYRFEKKSLKVSIQLGDDTVNNILLNTVAVFLFAYGRFIGKEYLIDRALALLEFLPAETNSITNRFSEIGLKPKQADDSQALLQLKKMYCDTKNCLTCGIGSKLINTA